MRLLKVTICLIISLSIMVVIFMLSAQNSGESGSLSDSIARMLANALVTGFANMGAEEQASIIESWSWPVRKTAHATEYGCLAISWFATCWQIRALRFERRGSASSFPVSRRSLLTVTFVAFCIAVAYACTDELHQLFIDGRAGQVADVLVDASGALVGCALSYAIMRVHLRFRGSQEKRRAISS